MVENPRHRFFYLGLLTPLLTEFCFRDRADATGDFDIQKNRIFHQNLGEAHWSFGQRDLVYSEFRLADVAEMLHLLRNQRKMKSFLAGEMICESEFFLFKSFFVASISNDFFLSKYLLDKLGSTKSLDFGENCISNLNGKIFLPPI